MAAKNITDEQVTEVWHRFMTTGYETSEFRHRRLFRLLPSEKRCRFCNAPFHGFGSRVIKILYNKEPSNMNPTLCNVCENFAREYQGGAEIELSLLFADVRGSTSLAEKMSPADFGKLINRFYTTASEILIKYDALIDKIIGDQASGIFVPGFAGADHARKACDAAQKILRATGHGSPEGPWIPIGAGIHTGVAFVGSVGEKEGTRDITVLGDTANTAARLSSSASVGEILVSEAAYSTAGLRTAGLRVDHSEKRNLTLKGKREQISVYVVKV